jgi:hypothetical protein
LQSVPAYVFPCVVSVAKFVWCVIDLGIFFCFSWVLIFYQERGTKLCVDFLFGVSLNGYEFVGTMMDD